MFNTASVLVPLYRWETGLREAQNVWVPLLRWMIKAETRIYWTLKCAFSYTHFCSPKFSGELTGFRFLRKSLRASTLHCLHLYSRNENYTSQRCWVGFRKLYFFLESCPVYLFSNALDIIHRILMIPTFFIICWYMSFLFILNIVYLCLPSPLPVMPEVFPLYWPAFSKNAVLFLDPF